MTTSDSDIGAAETTTLTVEDRLDISDLLSYYAHCVDSRRPDELVEVFAHDTDVSLGFGRWRGAEEVVRGIREVLNGLEATCHMISNERVTATPTGASSSCYVTAWHWVPTAQPTDPRPADFVFVGRYTDELRRVEGQWKISRRRSQTLGPTALAVGQPPPGMIPGAAPARARNGVLSDEESGNG